MQSYDLVAIGTGAAAATAAHKCREAGWRVAVVDSRPYGGTCALRGCDPKKVLVAAAHAVDAARRLSGHGVLGDVRLDWHDLQAFKRTFTEPVPEHRESAYHRAGIATLHGRARFTGPDTLDVGGERVEARHILVATGARPRPLGIPGEEHVATSTDFLDLEALPSRIVFIGGGFISFEFAHVAARAGADVTILHRSPQPLKEFDPDLVAKLVDASRALGIDVRLDAPVEAVHEDRGGFRVDTGGGSVDADLVVHGAGRVPEIDDLDLDAGDVAHTRRGVTVDRHLRSTTNPAVYAAGDAAATAGPPLTPVATAEGAVAGSNMLGGDERSVDYRGTASIVFTLPPLARVGLTVHEAHEQGLAFEVHEGDMRDWASHRRIRDHAAAFKVLVEKGTDRILGAHLLGEGADEVVNLFALAMRAGLPSSRLRTTPWGYPTHGSDVPYML